MNGDGNREKPLQALDVVTYISRGDRLGLEELERCGGKNWKVVAEVVAQIGEDKNIAWFGSGAHEVLAGVADERMRGAVAYDVEHYSLRSVSDLDLIVEDDVDLDGLVGKIASMGNCCLLTPEANGVSRNRLELTLDNGLIVEISQVENIEEQMKKVMLRHQGVGLRPVLESGRVVGVEVLDETDYLADNPAPFRVTSINPNWEGSIKWGDLKMALKAVAWMAQKGGSVKSIDWRVIGEKLIGEVEGGQIGGEQIDYIRQKMAKMMTDTYAYNRFDFWQAMVFKVPAVAVFSPTMANGFMDHPEWQNGILLKLLADETSGSKIEVEPQVMWEGVIGLMVAEATNDVDLGVVISELAENWPDKHRVDWGKISSEDGR
jgi:hypothetical protein